MTSSRFESLSDKLRSEFDDTFQYISHGSKKRKFSSERILTDMIESGISVFDSLDILYECRRSFHRGIKIEKIIQLINDSIIDHGYSDTYLIRGKTTPMVVEYPDYEEFLNFKQIKDIVSNELDEFTYSSKTFKIIVEELYRLLQSLRMNRFKIHNIRKMIPSVTRSVIELDPFDQQTVPDLYRKVISDYEILVEERQYTPEREQPQLLIDFLEDIFDLILLWFNYLPGHNVISTISQLNSLIAEISGERTSFTQRELYDIGKLSVNLRNIIKNKEQSSMVNNMEWIRGIHQLMDIVVRFAHQGIVKWLVLIDQYDREVYTLFSKSSEIRYQSMIGMAISGVHSLLNEVTNDSISIIEQNDGVIVVENRKEFRIVFFLSHRLNPRLQTILEHLTDLVQLTLADRLRNFKGEVKSIKLLLDPIVEDYLGIMFDK